MQPIIRDSEDEDDEEFLVPEDHAVSKPSQQSNNSWMVTTVDEILAENPTQRSEDADQSSLSTGNLQQQIADASRGLFDSTSDQATMKEHPPGSSSCSITRKARRHSAVIGSQSSAKAFKRTKTGTVTYGSSKNTRISDPINFDALRSEGLPGTMQANFANHEPSVMFRDSGSTVADNESSQQRMVEQTLNHGKQPFGVADRRPVDSDKPDSSPFPWPESSVPNQTSTGNVGKQSQQDTAMAQESVTNGSNPNAGRTVPAMLPSLVQFSAANDKEIDIQQDIVRPPPAAASGNVSVDHPLSKNRSSPAHPSESNTAAGGQSRFPRAQQSLNSSPQVSVPRVRVKSNTQTPAGADDALRGRKRKSSTAANIEMLNSEDRAIGHPKELYQPRLSRRRATGLVEQPQDFSILPEKDAKRRRKTVDMKSAAPEHGEDELALGPSAVSHSKGVPESNKSVESAGPLHESATTTTVQAMIEKPAPDRGEVRALLKDLDFPLTKTSFDAGNSEKPSPTKDASPLSAKKVTPAVVVAMPPPASPDLATSPTKRPFNAAAASAMPPPSSSAKRASRRSHTTIFEDHVDFGGSQQRSPSLRQQQADRKSAALKEFKNITTQATRRKRRSIVQDEDDDKDGEDELVKNHVAEVPVPKKRGRPAKAPTAKTAKKPSPADRVLQDSDVEPDDEDIVEPPKKEGRAAQPSTTKLARSAERVLEESEDDFNEHEYEKEEPPKKKSRGRPSKATISGAEDASASATGGKPISRRPSAASNPPATPPPEIQTPSLTKQDAGGKAAAPSKPAPAAHTPIKTTSKVIHRVGLNRRQRVQPLLKMVRPPAPAPAPAKKR